jgi:hypothetical protein
MTRVSIHLFLNPQGEVFLCLYLGNEVITTQTSKLSIKDYRHPGDVFNYRFVIYFYLSASRICLTPIFKRIETQAKFHNFFFRERLNHKSTG